MTLTSPAPTDPTGIPTPEFDDRLVTDLVAAVAQVMGSRPGHHITHAKAVVLSGTFTATSRAAELCRAAHLQGDPVPVTVRFSNGDPKADSHDAAEHDPRGMAVKFHLPDGSATDVVCQDWPVFPAGTPEGFLGLMRAQADGVEATERFLAEHPDIAEASAAVAAGGQPPRSWATHAFNSLNAFRLVDADGVGRFVRWRLEPDAGEEPLPAALRPTADRDYLMDGVLTLLPFRYTLRAQLAAETDQTTDASRAWPADREWVDMGTVEITAEDTSSGRDGHLLVNDPMRLTDGVEPSADPILHIRPLVYDASVRQRS